MPNVLPSGPPFVNILLLDQGVSKQVTPQSYIQSFENKLSLTVKDV